MVGGNSGDQTTQSVERILRSGSAPEDPDRTYVSNDIETSSEGMPRFRRYHMLQRLAAGGMAEIYLAQRLGSHKLSVIKQLHDHLARDEVVGHRFLREAEVAALLDHRNIARLTDAGREGDTFYLAMEYIPGADLEALILKLRSERRLPPYALTLALGLQVLDALDYAHSFKGADGQPLDIVHRDLSPRNVMLTYDGTIKVIDFGLARVNLGAFRTAPGMVLGTLRYMSPEQASGEQVDHRSDLYSWAAVLHEMLTGRAIVDGTKPNEILRAVLSEINKSLPKEIDLVFKQALSKDRSNRFQTAADFKKALGAAGASLGIADPESIAQFTRDAFPAEHKKTMKLLEQAEREPHTHASHEAGLDTDAISIYELGSEDLNPQLAATMAADRVFFDTNPALKITEPDFEDTLFATLDSDEFEVQVYDHTKVANPENTTPPAFNHTLLNATISDALDPTVAEATRSDATKKTNWAPLVSILAGVLLATGLVLVFLPKVFDRETIPTREISIAALSPEKHPAIPKKRTVHSLGQCEHTRLWDKLHAATAPKDTKTLKQIAREIRKEAQTLEKKTKNRRKTKKQTQQVKTCIKNAPLKPDAIERCLTLLTATCKATK